jgi:hypothetical protein
MHGPRSKIPSTKSRPYIYIYVKFLALLGAPYIYAISRLRINPLNAELNPICHLLALLGGATLVVVSRIRVKEMFAGKYGKIPINSIHSELYVGLTLQHELCVQ